MCPHRASPATFCDIVYSCVIGAASVLEASRYNDSWPYCLVWFPLASFVRSDIMWLCMGSLELQATHRFLACPMRWVGGQGNKLCCDIGFRAGGHRWLGHCIWWGAGHGGHRQIILPRPEEPKSSASRLPCEFGCSRPGSGSNINQTRSDERV